ncbi:glycosyltransferase [Nocardioides sp. URHA0020]|uniref:glycosyltransferase n=1 Tax=Nocardioides sp. URHA0020 TaxID=1380392 RepID=UPI00048A909A|nr:glycosyltransferase [Nocardioides sp. URHA0020]
MRALTVIAEMGSGGAETVVADLAGHLVATGQEACVASSGGWRVEALEAAGVATLAVPLRASGPASLGCAVARLRRETAARPVDLVHAHNVRASVAAHLGTRAGRRSRPPLVTTVHGLADGDYTRAARVLGVSDVVVAVSDDVAERLVVGGLDPARLRVVANAVPAPVAEPDLRDEVRGELGLASAAPVVLCVARLATPKRIDLLLDAWADVPDATLLVAGDGPDREALVRRAATLGDRVRFLGERRDVGRLLGAVDLLVLPSDREGLPMAVLEALAAGVPVVASAVGGIPVLGPHAVELVTPGRADALADGVRRLLDDPRRRRDLTTAGPLLVRERFSSARMQSDYLEVYGRALEARSRPS